jgi:hypothetical protein
MDVIDRFLPAEVMWSTDDGAPALVADAGCHWVILPIPPMALS